MLIQVLGYGVSPVPDEKDFVMRGPHPFAYFIFRPFGLLFTPQQMILLYLPLLLNTFTGRVCVFLAWLFIKRQFQNDIYALLIAGLLGVSTSHLFFGSVVETYIFSAMSLILFFFLLAADRRSLLPLILAGTLTFGITITNFVQNGLGFIVHRPSWKEIFRFFDGRFLFPLFLVFMLLYIHLASCFSFFHPHELKRSFSMEYSRCQGGGQLGEQSIYCVLFFFIQLLLQMCMCFVMRWVAISRSFDFSRSCPVRFLIVDMMVWGTALVLIWSFMLLIAGGVFIWKLISTRKVEFTLAFALCIFCNLCLHSYYGQELFLYSPDWAFALIFFVAFGLARFRENRIFQAGMIIFLMILAINQLGFMNIIIDALLPYKWFVMLMFA